MSDPLKYRKDKDGHWLPEVDEARKRDPILLYQKKLAQAGLITDEQIDAMDQSVIDEVNQAAEQAEADPFPALEERFDDILVEKYPYLPE